jgi:hypothetical protein
MLCNYGAVVNIFIGGPTHFYWRPNRGVQGFAAVSGRKWSNPEVEQQEFAAAQFANPLLVQIFSDWIPFPEIPRLKARSSIPHRVTGKYTRLGSPRGMIAPANFDHSGRQGQTGYYLGVNGSPIGVNGDAGQAVSRQLQKRHTLIPIGRLTASVNLCISSLIGAGSTR